VRRTFLYSFLFLTLMQLKLGGIAALLIGIIILIFLVVMLVIVGSIFLIAVPILIALGLVMFIIRRIIPQKKPKQAKKNYIDAEFKVKE